MMSANRGRAEVNGAQSNRRLGPEPDKGRRGGVSRSCNPLALRFAPQLFFFNLNHPLTADRLSYPDK
jgi:hypothetical protein